MADISPTRPTRRAATRRKVVVESSDEDDKMDIDLPQQDDDSEEFTPAPKRTPRRQSRRKTTNGAAQTPRTTARRVRPKTGDGLEPSVLDDEGDGSNAPPSPTRRGSPRKRKTISAEARRQSAIPNLPPPAPTPRLSEVPEPVKATPLADITNMANGDVSQVEQPAPEVITKPIPPNVLEKPMDIVIRSRSMPQPLSQEPTGPKARIVLTYLILINFKSYAGRQVVGPFHSSFSSVVGPNGSGKSNVIDSLLFVFGFRASKMRQGKISALIHKSAAFPDLGSCEVEVRFQEVMDLVR